MKSRKALSEIIASMVILIIVSTLGVILYNLSLSTMNTQQENMLLDLGREEGIARERFEIIGVTRVRDTILLLDNMAITYINYGEVDVRITDVYIDGVRYPIALVDQKLCSRMDISIITSKFVLPENRIQYEVRIVSERGVTTDASVYL
jgi:hypothetical protein